MAYTDFVKAENGAQPRIQIATVEILVMKIGSKQMTQAVFNQLEEYPIIEDATGLLRGTPWGWINYKTEGRRRNYVWEHGGKLYRSLVHRDGPITCFTSEWLGDHSRHLDELMARGLSCSKRLATHLLLAGEITTSTEWHDIASFFVNDKLGREVSPTKIDNYPPWSSSEPPDHFSAEFPVERAVFGLNERQREIVAELEFAEQCEDSTKDWRLKQAHDRQARVDRWLEALRVGFYQPTAEPMLEKALEGATRDVREFLAVWNKSLETLNECSQLFIAV